MLQIRKSATSVAENGENEENGERRAKTGRKKLIDHSQLLLMWPVIMSNGQRLQLLHLASGFN